MNRIVFAVWLLVGVIMLVVAFGPARSWASRGEAVTLLATALTEQSRAESFQKAAALANATAVEARVAAKRNPTAQAVAWAAEATRKEEEAYHAAHEAWSQVASTLTQVRAGLGGQPVDAEAQVRLLHNRALVGAGQITAAVTDLESMLEESRGHEGDQFRVHEELANAYYFGARLLRLSGRDENEWRAVADRARQHARYLAELTGPSAPSQVGRAAYQRNLEIILDMERRSTDELQATPSPDNSPSLCTGKACLDGWPWARPGKRPGPHDPRGEPQRGGGESEETGGGS